MSGAELPTPTVGNLRSFEELDKSLDLKGKAQPSDDLYPRDGTALVARIEELVSTVTVPEQPIIWASGMAAVRETVNFAAAYTAERRRKPPVIAYAMELYSQASAFFAMEKKKGVNTVGFDSGDEEDVRDSINVKGATVLFAETVANTAGMPVLNIHKLLEQVRESEDPPILVLDNTLPLSTGIDFKTLLRPNDPVIIVESGTKMYMNNSDVLGVSYSPNKALIESLRGHKAHSGAINSISGLEIIARKLTQTLPGFHNRNRAVFETTSGIAAALSEAYAELGSQADFDTTFPSHPSHPNHEYAKQLAPEGGFISPVVFITAGQWTREGVTNLFRRIVEHPAIREQIDEGEIYLGQSFGLSKARVLYDRNAPTIRFAGGFDPADPVKLTAAIKEALADK